MTITNKILLIIIGLISATAFGFIIYQQHQFQKQALDIQNSMVELKQLADNVVRSQSQYVNQAGFNDFIKANQVNLDGIQKDISSLGGQISAINVVVANSGGQTVNGVPSTITTPVSPTPIPINCVGSNCVQDKFNYFGTTQTLKLNEYFGANKEVSVPIGDVGFSAGSPENKPWQYNILPRQYSLDTTIAHKADGQSLVYNSLSIKAGDKNYTIPISSSNTVERYPANSFTLWNPRLSAGFTASGSIGNSMVNAEATPGLSISVASYGKTLADPDIRFVSVGPGYNIVAKKLNVELSPIQINVGKMITGGKLINNLWLGPVIGVNTAGALQVGAGFQVSL